MVNLIHGECLNEMDKLINQGITVDMILSDLPYGTTDCKWDNIIPFNELWSRYKQLIKNNGCIALFGTEPFSSLLRTSNLEMYKYDWFWVKNDSTDAMNAKNKPMRKIEKIHIFSKANIANGAKNKMVYYPQGLISSNIKRIGNDYGATGGSFKTYRPSHKPYIQKYTGYPNDLLYYPKDKEKYHPTQKPVILCEYLIKTYTKENEIILDNCCGSGSTGVACKNLNRNFIGIEINEKYYCIAEDRIKYCLL